MDYREIFDETLKLFNVRAAELALKSGVGENQISKFRNNKSDLYTETLQKLVDALPDDARAYFYSRVIGAKTSSAA